MIQSLVLASKGAINGLPEANLKQSPIQLFEDWFNDAKKSGLFLPEAMSISTVNSAGEVSSRMVLLKSFNKDGFIFYTNYNSQKAQDIENNAQVALLFHWDILQRQVRVKGRIEKISAEKSAKYFASRERGSQLAAWASKQSHVVDSRQKMEQAYQQQEQQFAGKEVVCPEFWGGYQIVPNQIEFWQGRVNRFHDRFVFKKDKAKNWSSERLYP